MAARPKRANTGSTQVRSWRDRSRLVRGWRVLRFIRQRRIRCHVRCVYDPAKDRTNRAKHGVFLALAEVLFAGPHLSVTDDRFEYGEVREVAFGLINDRLFVCVYTDRDAERRIISLRRANRREVKRYGENLE